MCLVETWLGSDVLDEVWIPNYSIVRLDRTRHGGGVAMYIHDSVAYNVLPYGSADLELLLVALSRNNFQLCLCVFYRPPSSPSIFDTLCETLLSVPHSNFSNFVILCGFNVNFDVSHHFIHISLILWLVLHCPKL